MSTDTNPQRDEVPAWLAHVPVTVDAHIRSGSELTVSLHPAEGWLVLSIGGSNNAAVHLFTPRAELVRLIEVASAGLAELDAQAAVIGDTASTAAGVESAA